MADVRDRLPENTPGAYYITEECIDCDLCSEILPEVFFEVEGRHFVGKQPEKAAEVTLVEEAIDSCPTEAIGDDGEES